jgi:hypothetical protein
MATRATAGRLSILSILSILVAGCGGPASPPPPAAATTAPATPTTAVHPGDRTHSSLDVDGNGVVEPYTDSMLIFRYTAGMRGNTLVMGAVSKNCTRCTAEQIEAYLGSL